VASPDADPPQDGQEQDALDEHRSLAILRLILPWVAAIAVLFLLGAHTFS
jgi:hypothetical protein